MPRPKRHRDDPALQPVPAAILDQFVADGLLTAQDIEAAMRRFKKALIERALGAELTHHLRYPTGAPTPDDAGNKRNGTTPKSVLTEDGLGRHGRAPRPRRVVRAGADSQARAAVHRLRRHGPRAPCARPAGARDSEVSRP